MSTRVIYYFIYRGGRAPFVRFAVIDQCVTSISASAFERNGNLLDVQLHNFVDTIETHAFCLCSSLTHMVMLGVKNVDYSAFYACWELSCVEFGKNLETIGESAFDQCTSLRHIKMPNVLGLGFVHFKIVRSLSWTYHWDLKLSRDKHSVGVNLSHEYPCR